MTTHRITADIDADAQSIANHLASAAVLTNKMTERVLALSDADLTAWLNSQGDPTPLFAAHGQLGEAINAAAQVATGTLNQWGLEPTIPTVDVRSVSQKLAAQNRAIVVDSSGWQVVPIPPQAAITPSPPEESEE